MSAACYLAFPCGFAHMRPVAALSWLFPVASRRLAGCPFRSVFLSTLLRPFELLKKNHAVALRKLVASAICRSSALRCTYSFPILPSQNGANPFSNRLHSILIDWATPPSASQGRMHRRQIRSMAAAVAWVQLANEPSYHRDDCV